MAKERTCRVCGCTDSRACVGDRGPCWWVEGDVCNYCQIKEHARLPVCGTKAGCRQHMKAMAELQYVRTAIMLAQQDVTLGGLVNLIWSARQEQENCKLTWRFTHGRASPSGKIL